ncbi:MAG: GDSL-type esterase/lipase family protein [Actinomycetota bacterium]|nr:GDSL-type esterase/lipase family protein [Actinomycetota bacterium]
MRRRATRLLSALSLAGVTLLVAPGIAAAAVDGAGPPPSSMASLGDSITRGFDACGFYLDCTNESWSTGADPAINSHYRRILAVNPAISGHNNNNAMTGAKAADLPGQAQTAVAQGVQYVTILIGANDACTSSEATMTPVSTYRSQIDAALTTLRSGLPDAKILVVSIPDIKRLWAIDRYNLGALTIWSMAHICQSMLANPLSNSSTDNARRDRVRQRVIDFNAQLADACAGYGSNCHYDGGTVFNYPFVTSQISGWDYFHPSRSGQTVLASITYAAGYDW